VAQDRPSAATSIALAEFGALREEIGRRSTTQQALLGLLLTISTTMYGATLSRRIPVHLLLALPFVTAPLAMQFIDHHWTICHIGAYIRNDIRAVLTRLVRFGDDELDPLLFAWEVRVEEERQTSGLWWQGSTLGALVGPGFVAPLGWCLALFATRHAPGPALDFAWRLPAFTALLLGLWVNASVISRWRNDPVAVRDPRSRPEPRRDVPPRPAAVRFARAALAGSAIVGVLSVVVLSVLSPDSAVQEWAWGWGRPMAGALALVGVPLSMHGLHRSRAAARHPAG
jgi:hypothetical protein